MSYTILPIPEPGWIKPGPMPPPISVEPGPEPPIFRPGPGPVPPRRRKPERIPGRVYPWGLTPPGLRLLDKFPWWPIIIIAGGLLLVSRKKFRM